MLNNSLRGLVGLSIREVVCTESKVLFMVGFKTGMYTTGWFFGKAVRSVDYVVSQVHNVKTFSKNFKADTRD